MKTFTSDEKGASMQEHRSRQSVPPYIPEKIDLASCPGWIEINSTQFSQMDEVLY
jgi:hypothetical protein